MSNATEITSPTQMCALVKANIERLMATRNMSVTDLAHRAGIDEKKLRKQLETGHLTMGMLYEVAVALGVRATALVMTSQGTIEAISESLNEAASLFESADEDVRLAFGEVGGSLLARLNAGVPA